MIRNREAANVQLTAEQLIYDAKTQFAPSGGEGDLLASQRDEPWKLMDRDELQQYLQRKRKEYEDRIRKDRKSARAYMDYARFEAKQNDVRRARSVFERALTVLSANALVWLAYAEIEAKAGYIAHALNVLHRAVELLPRENKLWFQYALYQETAGDSVEETRAVFERWMRWQPPNNEPWFAYAAFEERQGEEARARDVYERFCGAHATAKAYIKFAKWEERKQNIANARMVFERAIGAYVDAETDRELPAELAEAELARADVWLAFAQFESRQAEPERARAVYEFALERVSAEEKARVFAAFAAFEKRIITSQHDEQDNADSIVLLRRRNDYEERLREDSQNYDVWLDLCKLEESLGKANADRVRDTYARAQAQAPPQREKRFWRRYIYLFIFHAIFEELVMGEVDRARAVLQAALKVIPHKQFTFAKIWILAANLELRQLRLSDARKLLGASIGMCAKDKTFRTYIQLELQLGQVERCRVLYEKYLCWAPTNSKAWAKYAEMENSVGETKRARSIFELGVAQPALDEPEKLWLRYIDFELACKDEEEEEEEALPPAQERAKQLYLRLVDRTEGKAAKVWIAFAKFLATTTTGKEEEARQALDRGEESCRALPDQRALICQAKVDFEEKHGTEQTLLAARRQLPTRMERLDESSGALLSEWLFPRDVEEQAARDAASEATSKAKAALRLMEMAKLHKKQRLDKQQDSTTDM